jgi:hypothetical protein
MMRRHRLFLAPFVLALLGACAGQPAPARSPTPKKSATEKPKEPRQQLLEALRAIPRGDTPLNALGAPVRRELEAFVAKLSEPERAALAKANGPFARERPLLHWAAGGTSDEATYRLATGPRLAQDLLTMRAASERRDVADLLPALQNVSKAAAARWLHDHAADVAIPDNVTLALLDRIDEVAESIERWDLVQLARELATEKDADSVDRFIALARARARELDTEGSKSALSRAEKIGASNEKQAARLERAAKAVAAAATVAKLTRASDPAGRLTLARAHLDLGRAKDAALALAPDRAAAPGSLALAAALAEADLGGTLCPGIPSGVGNTLFCATAWTHDPQVAPAVKMLEAAWKSGGGRDDRAIESYLALVHIAPWMYGAATGDDGSSAEAVQQKFLERLDAMRRAAEAASSRSPHFRGALLFADAIGVGFRAATSKGARLEPKDRRALQERAAALAAELPNDALAQAGVLAVAALSFRDDDVEPLLAKLPAKVAAANFLPCQVMRLWVAASKKEPELARSASGEIAALLPELASDELDRARLVLLLAESDVALQGNERSYQVLEQVAKPLTGEEVPLELRLRAAIDYAGTRARAGKSNEGADLLERVVTNARVTQSDEKSLGLIAGSYLYVLRARDAKKPADRAEYRDKLVAMEHEPIGQDMPDATRLWRGLWQKELDFLVDADRCKNLRPCLEKARRKQGDGLSDAVAGSEVAKLVRRGVLPGGSLSLTFAFGSSGLEALVSVTPALLAVESPDPTRVQP